MEDLQVGQTGFVIEQDAPRIIQTPVRETHSSLTGYIEEIHGINVKVVQGGEDTFHTIYDKTVHQGWRYDKRIAKVMKKAQRVAGALAVSSDVE